MKKAVKILIIIIGALVLLAACGYFLLNPYIGTVNDYQETLPLEATLSKAQAQEDLSFLIKHLRGRHPAWLEKGNDAVNAVEAQYEAEIASLSDAPTVMDVWQASARITAAMHDSHTCVWVNVPQRYISDFSQIREYGTPVMINGEPTEQVYDRFCSVYQFELESRCKKFFTNTTLFCENYLLLSGVDTSEGVTYTFDIDGEPTEIHYDFVAYDEIVGYEPSTPEDWVYYEIDKENNAAVFTLTECTFNEKYKTTVKNFFDDVAENGITNVIIDLRDNGGGNSLVADHFLRYVDVDGYFSWESKIRLGDILVSMPRTWSKNLVLEPTFSGDIYVLTDNYTHSSAMDFTMLVCDNGIGKIVGEESGNLPASYGDCLNFRLPNTMINLLVSYNKWYRVDVSMAELPLTPDYPCSPHDALDKAYEIISEQSR